jgi:hypothetical protein
MASVQEVITQTLDGVAVHAYGSFAVADSQADEARALLRKLPDDVKVIESPPDSARFVLVQKGVNADVL